MRPAPNERAEQMRQAGPVGSNNGLFIGGQRTFLKMIVSNGAGWDHVSVSLHTRCPTWDEMCWVKRLWFGDDEVVVEYHPAASEYVNNHPFCLHLWRPQTKTEIEAIRSDWGEEWMWGDLNPPGVIPTPPVELVEINPGAKASFA